MNSFIITNANIVTPEKNFTGSLIVENGLITEIKQDTFYKEGIDLQGNWLTPGCIDIHSDYIEKELHPRPSANFPLPLAFHFMDQRAAACGITTLYSAVSFSDNPEMDRSFDKAIDLSKGIDKLRQNALIRHLIHARLDPNSEVVDAYFEAMLEIESLGIIIYNENIPGQRQFDKQTQIRRRVKHWGISIEEATLKINEAIEKLSKINKRPEIQEAFEGKILLGSHDDTTKEHVYEAKYYGAELSEMPTTIEAARQARALNLFICMGAPNFVRGGSHCGNLSCHEAMEEGLVDLLCSDYHFPTLLTAVIRMMNEGISPSVAMNYVSLNPARLMKLDDKIGSIEVGKEADLLSFNSENDYADISHVWVNGVLKYFVHKEGVALVKN